MSLRSESREAMLALALWQRDPRAGNLRAVLYQYLIEATLSQAEAPITRATIEVQIRSSLTPGTVFDGTAFASALEPLVALGHVLESDGVLILADDHARLLYEAQVEFEKDEEGFDSEFSANIRLSTIESLPEATVDEILEALKSTLQRFLLENSIRLAHKQTDVDSDDLLKDERGYEESLRQAISVCLPGSVHLVDETLDGIKSALSTPSARSKSFLKVLHRRVTLGQILQADPAVLSLQMEALRQTEVLLDTRLRL